MRKLIAFIAIPMILSLGACASVKSPTPGSNKIAPPSQVAAVKRWENACVFWANLEKSVVIARQQGALQGTATQRIRVIQQSITPLCQSFPANSSAAITSIISAGIQLTALLPPQYRPITPPPIPATGGKP